MAERAGQIAFRRVAGESFAAPFFNHTSLKMDITLPELDVLR
jgi:hypothetical protein